MGKTNNFPGLKNETETETFNFGLMEPRPRPRLSFWVSWNRDRDRDFNMKSRETETFTRPDILSLGGTETGTETTKVSVLRVSAPRPPISDKYISTNQTKLAHPKAGLASALNNSPIQLDLDKWLTMQSNSR